MEAQEKEAAREAGGAPGAMDRGRALLDLAERLGNVSEACRRLGVDRTAYYRARRAALGNIGDTLAGRAGLPREEIAARVRALALDYPEWGCDRIALYLRLTGHPVSSPTVQKVLVRMGLGRMAQRRGAAAERREKSTKREEREG